MLNSKTLPRPKVATPRILLGLTLGLALAGSLSAQKVPVVEKTLPNGMKLLMVERPDDPTVAGGWVAHVGSANERRDLNQRMNHG